MSKAIIESASGHACEDLDLEPLQGRLQDLIRRKRYLLVLDDVWNDDQENWDRLKHVLACGSKGASILVTTRLTKVASIMGTKPPHQLSMLSEDDCWEVFKQRAFGPEEGEHAELVVIGKEIVKKCRGVPLAAKALGSLLRFKNEEKDWLHVKESKIWSLPQHQNSILPALKLSYLNLPVNLRQCFTYCALFPKNEEINKQLVIHLWMANGFISSNEMLEVEDIGDEVWNELYWRSFFQDIKMDEFGNITSFKMHDLVHDLAQSVMKECCCITNDNAAANLSEKTRHLSHYGGGPSDAGPSLHLHQVKSLKTYITPIYYSDCIPPDILMKCYSLRVLDIMRLKDVSSSIGHLKHLRYLNLSYGLFETLPDSICRLWNLQILRLDYCDYLEKLPDGLKCLKSLRHLYLEGCIFLSSLAPEMGQLTSLKTLNIYIVGEKKGYLLAELGRLNLKGKLHIKHLERVRSVMDAKEANLAGKHLKDLVLSWERNEESLLQENVEQILEVLQPHRQLKTLEIEAYMGVQFPQWMGSPSLKDLHLIELVDCKNCLCLLPLGKLPSLKKLKIYNMVHVQYVDEESYDGEVVERGFKALEILMLYKLPNLIRLSKEDGDNMFLRLSVMEIALCPKLVLPRLPSVIELRIKEKCSQSLLGSIYNLCNLQSLWFRCNEELIAFPDEMVGGLTCLKELHVCDHSKLQVFPTELINSNALEELHIELCHNLEPLTEQVLQGLHSLKRLKIGWYPKFKFFAGFQYLASLEDLMIGSCPEVESFPEALQHITTLRSLSLFDLPNLASLPDWLGNLRLLQSLFISECPKLMSLPMSIQCLGNLKNLHIYLCPELQNRCEKETGEDWHKIAHVPSTYIGSQSLLPNGYFGPRWFTTDLLFE